MNISNYLRPESLEEACEILQNKNAVIIGGGAFLNLGNREVSTAVDLSKLKLDYIVETAEGIEIGAMTTLREIETNMLLKEIYDGILSKALSEIVGVQLRNTATIGGTIWGRYGFSDVLSTLLAMDARVELLKGGEMSLEEFLEGKLERDIIVKVIISKGEGRAAFKSIRNTAGDISILNTAVVKRENSFRICVGARPGIAKLAVEAMKYLGSEGADEAKAGKAAEIASESLRFGSDMRGSAEYRKELCKSLVKRCILEVL